MLFTYLAKKDFLVYRIEGEVDFDHARELKEHFERSIMNGVIRYIINLSQVPNIDSTGIGTLIYLVTNVRKKNGMVFLTDVNKTVRHLIELSCLTEYFHMVKTESDAVQTISGLSAFLTE